MKAPKLPLFPSMPDLPVEPEPVDASNIKLWMLHISTRLGRLEKLVWSFSGGVAALQLLRACSGHG